MRGSSMIPLRGDLLPVGEVLPCGDWTNVRGVKAVTA